MFRIGGISDADLFFAQEMVEGVEEGVVAGEFFPEVGRHGDDVRGFDSKYGRMPVGADEAAGAQFDAAEVARDDDDNIREIVFLDGFQDGIACSASRLAVVVGFLLVSRCSQHPGGTVMAGIEVGFLLLCDEFAGILLIFHMLCMGDEAGSLYLIVGGAFALDGSIAFHVIPPHQESSGMVR